MWHAWVDESEPGPHNTPRAYLLAAALCEPHEVDSVRAGMQLLRLNGQHKLHWHDESPSRRRKIIEAIASYRCLEHLVVVRDSRQGEPSERRRRLCLERLFYELDQLEVERVCLEARERKQNMRDMSMLSALRARKIVTSRLRIDHVPGRGDPALWVPDAVCGAYGAQLTGHTSDPLWSPIEARATVLTVA